MAVMRVAVDFLEIASVFLLAVEAIKLQNLAWLRTQAIKPLLDHMNPAITFVEEHPPNAKFMERHALELILFVMYLCGCLVIALSLHALGISYSSLAPQTVVAWVLVCFAVIFAPLLAGSVTYTTIVSGVERLIRALTWVEAHTHSGAVGILGFALYLIQFTARRALAL